MGLRITTWNVNGIRNPFGYQPWRDRRTFEGMFDLLEADIVVFQETKIQRKDLRDDMVLVPGWDCYWSLPKHKKGAFTRAETHVQELTETGYSGVVIYTRNSACAPIRAEEGITGILTPPNSSISFRDLLAEEHIGGYPSIEQLSQSELDASTLDCEGRCVLLEFPAFVLIGTYCPAERDATRTEFRSGFLHVLDSRIRNLIAMGKRVVWTGDLNISREEKDTAMAEEMMRKNNVDSIDWISSPARRLLNQLVLGGQVHGERDEGREQPVMWDICRAFHPSRKGMYTCWETKVNARPGNYGARIDYVLCSTDMMEWFSDSNIQEGLLGSDHCPVYAVLKDRVLIKDQEKHISDIMNPLGTFENGVRRSEWSPKNLLPMSGKLIPEFDRRRNIRDMFSRKSSSSVGDSLLEAYPNVQEMPSTFPTQPSTSTASDVVAIPQHTAYTPLKTTANKRARRTDGPLPATKKTKPGLQSADSNGASKGQQSLKGFFMAKTAPLALDNDSDPTSTVNAVNAGKANELPVTPNSQEPNSFTAISPALVRIDTPPEDEAASLESKRSWGKLFAKPIAPKCEHEEPCKTMLTKKPGVNCGRSFWMCNRPLGPSGKKERATEWRCNTFIWTSDWDGHAGGPG